LTKNYFTHKLNVIGRGSSFLFSFERRVVFYVCNILYYILMSISSSPNSNMPILLDWM